MQIASYISGIFMLKIKEIIELTKLKNIVNLQIIKWHKFGKLTLKDIFTSN